MYALSKMGGREHSGPRDSRQRGKGYTGGEGEKKKEYVADVARACGSARSTGNFQSAFRVSAFEARGERVCVTLLADTGGFERKAHKYA